jgi:hypothetical protein
MLDRLWVLVLSTKEEGHVLRGIVCIDPRTMYAMQEE